MVFRIKGGVPGIKTHGRRDEAPDAGPGQFEMEELSVARVPSPANADICNEAGRSQEPISFYGPRSIRR